MIGYNRIGEARSCHLILSHLISSNNHDFTMMAASPSNNNSEEVFEINDYTCCTSLEYLIAALEDKFTSFNHLDKEVSPLSYNITTQNYNFTLFLYNYSNEENNLVNCVPNKINNCSHPITVRYGVVSFLLILPSQPISVNSSNFLLSAATIAGYNAHLTLPIFIQVNNDNYIGRTVYSKYRNCNYEYRSYEASKIPSNLKHLSGITEKFIDYNKGLLNEATKNHLLPSNCTLELSKCSISASFIYCQSSAEWDEAYRAELLNNNGFQLEEDSMEPLDRVAWRDTGNEFVCTLGLNYGPVQNPIESYLLTAHWPFFPAGTFVDNPVYSDFNVIHAPEAYLTVEYSKNENHATPLTQSLVELLRCCELGQNLSSIASVLDNNNHGSLTNNDSNTNLLRSVHNSLVDHINSANLTAFHGAVPQQAQIDEIIKQLLDKESEEIQIISSHEADERDEMREKLCSKVSAVPFASVLSRLVSHLLQLNFKGFLTVRSICLLWTEFVSELRFHYETALTLPNLRSTDHPNLHMAVIHQKLQLLNRCIKIIKQKAQSSREEEEREEEAVVDLSPMKGSSKNSAKESAVWDDIEVSTEDEEFLISLAVEDSKLRAAEGTDYISKELKLLSVDFPVNIPVLNAPVLMSSDELEEYNELLLRLGDNEEGSRIRAELQSSSLFSDMQAFKAANPGGILHDFIRWHSPNDWKSQQGKRLGNLSTRMQREGNLWKKLWKEAAAIPSSQQAPLFNPIGSAEKILNYLETLAPNLLFQQIGKIAISNVLNLFYSVLPQLALTGTHLTQQITSLHHYLTANHLNVGELQAEFNRVELSVARAVSLHHTFNKLNKNSNPSTPSIIKELINNNRYECVGSADRLLVQSLFSGLNESPADAIHYTLFTPAYTSSSISANSQATVGGNRFFVELYNPRATNSSLALINNSPSIVLRINTALNHFISE
jgi:hypothetical protein